MYFKMAALHLVIVAAVLAATVAPTTAQNFATKAAREEKQKQAENECSAVKPIPPETSTLCHSLCMLKSFGAVDKDGRFVTSGMSDFLYIMRGFTRYQSDTVAEECDAMNDHIEPGCDRVKQWAECYNAGVTKLFYKH